MVPTVDDYTELGGPDETVDVDIGGNTLKACQIYKLPSEGTLCVRVDQESYPRGGAVDFSMATTDTTEIKTPLEKFIGKVGTIEIDAEHVTLYVERGG